MVKRLEKEHICPFCHEKPENILQEGKHFLVLPARAPYIKHHILIVPKRHVNLLATLTHAELFEMHKLVDTWTRNLHKKYKDVSLLLRDGLVKDITINKSINHLHFHLLPNVGVHIMNATHPRGGDRKWIEDKAYTKIAQAYKKTFLA